MPRSLVLACSIVMLFACLAELFAQTPLRTELVASNLSRPVLVTAPEGDFDRLFVVEQTGTIRIIKNGNLLATPFLDITSTVDFGGERGLLGLAFHPDYDSNGEFYVYHNIYPFVNVALRRFTVSAANPDVADPTSGTDLLNLPGVYGNHNGGMIAFGPDGLLYIAIGDGGSTGPNWQSDPFNHAQRGDSLLGKMLRLDVDNPSPPLQYGIPPSNPFVGPGDPRDEIWALGLRNPWRFSFDQLTGDLWIADVGGAREEVDFTPAGDPGGRNYGWSCMSGTACNTTSCVCNSSGLTLPIHDYGAPGGRAIIGGYVYRGALIPDLRGTYFHGDYVRNEVWSFRWNGTAMSQLTDRTTELAPASPLTFGGISALGQDGRGELYICDIAGRVFRIEPTVPVITGVAPYGAGAAGCNGFHSLLAMSSPVIGNLAFELECNNAPPTSLGFMAVGTLPDIAGSDPFGLGFNFHFQLGPSVLATQFYSSDASGIGRYPLPIPGSAGLVGLVLYAQTLWTWDPAVCSPTPNGFSASHGLAVTLQP